MLHRHIVIPATIRIQRIYRGRLAKFVLAKLKVRAAAVKTLQDFIRAFVHRMWQHELDLEVKRKHAATEIQRLYRGTLDRQLCRMKAHIRWYNTRYIPAIIYIQASTRRYRAAKYVYFLKNKNRAVLKIQHTFANYCARKLAKAVVRDLKKMREFRAASNIQRYVRRRIAIVAYRRKILEYKGKITAAAKIIMRAWTNYLLSRRYKHLLDEHRRKAFGKRILKLIGSREDVHLDVKEIQVDIALATRAIERYKERIKLVETFEAQASIRQGKVKLEMSQLKVEDFERGEYMCPDRACGSLEGCRSSLCNVCSRITMRTVSLFRKPCVADLLVRVGHDARRLGGGAGAGVRDAELPDADESRGDAPAEAPHQAAAARDPVPADRARGDRDGHGHHGGECAIVGLPRLAVFTRCCDCRGSRCFCVCVS
jgi:hypothetical protein